MSLPPDALRRAEEATRRRNAQPTIIRPYRPDDPPSLGEAPPVPPPGFTACGNPACFAWVPRSVVYCCLGCSRSHEMKCEPHEEPDSMFGHSTECLGLQRERGTQHRGGLG